MLITFSLRFPCGNLKSLSVLSFTGGNRSTPQINIPLYPREELMELLPAKRE